MAKNITKSPNDARAPGLAEFAKSNGIKIPLELIPEKNNISKSVARIPKDNCDILTAIIYKQNFVSIVN